MNLIETFFIRAWQVTLLNGVRYFVAAGLAWLFFYVLFRRRWRHRKIVAEFPVGSDIRRELRYSIQSLFIFGASGAVIFIARAHGFTRIYLKMDEYGAAWFAASVVLAIFIHDAYFYWTHRLMHHPRLFRRFHGVHHLSKNPNPWTSYSFSPLEAVVQAGIVPLLVTIMPMHPLAIFLFLLWQIVFTVAGHTGFEIYPHWLLDTPLGRFLNTPTNHTTHHETFRFSYGLYFNFWDRWMHTAHPRADERFREITARRG